MAGQRVTPIVGVAREIIEQRLSGVEKGPLFLLEKGVVVTSAHIGHYLLTRRTTLPIAVFTSHDLRRTFATMLAEMGIALDLVSAIVGHESGGRDTRTLVRHYVHTDMLERQAHALQVVGSTAEGDCYGRGGREGGAAAPSRVINYVCQRWPDRQARMLVRRPIIAGAGSRTESVFGKLTTSNSNTDLGRHPDPELRASPFFADRAYRQPRVPISASAATPSRVHFSSQPACICRFLLSDRRLWGSS